MDELLLIGAPFLIFLVAAVWAGYSIGKTAPDSEPSLLDGPGSPNVRATIRTRLGPTGLVLLAAALTVLAAAAATAAGAFARLTNAGFPAEPAALLFGLEAVVDFALAAAVVLPGWSARRGWVMRTIGAYWLCLALPIMILADGGPGWISGNPGFGMTLLGLPSFVWEAFAVVLPSLLIWRASRPLPA